MYTSRSDGKSDTQIISICFGGLQIRHCDLPGSASHSRMRQMMKRNSAVKNVLPPIVRTGPGDSSHGYKGHTYKNPVANIPIRLIFCETFICSFHIETAGMMISHKSNAALTAALAPEPSQTSFMTQFSSRLNINWQAKGLQAKMEVRKYANTNNMLKICVPQRTHLSVLLVVSKMRW